MSDKNMSDAEDIPSDFFDDFSKEDFIEGLSVIDSWGDGKATTTIESDTAGTGSKLPGKVYDVKTYMNKFKMVRRKFYEPNQPPKKNQLDEYIKPGSRRNPDLTNEAIRKDKEVKVKEFLAKSLASTDDIKPPGTELDDYLECSSKPVKKSLTPARKKENKSRSRSRSYHSSERLSHKFKDNFHPYPGYVPRNGRRVYRSVRGGHHRRGSPLRYGREQYIARPKRYKSRSRSPQRYSRRSRSTSRHSPHRRSQQHPRSSQRLSPHRRSPQRRSSHRRSPNRRSSRHRSYSHHSRSPTYSSRRRSKSPIQDQFLYPDHTYQYAPIPQPNSTYALEPYAQPSTPLWETNSVAPLYSGPVSDSCVYPPAPEAGSMYSYSGSYDYGATSGMQVPAPTYHPGPVEGAPVPVPAPIPAPVPAPVLAPEFQQSSPNQEMGNITDNLLNRYSAPRPPVDALAQLVADGSISQEDYLKLVPHKGKPGYVMDIKEKVELLSRCHDAVTNLTKLHLPNRLVMLNQLSGVDTKQLMPRYCSPLKRQAIVNFHFTNITGAGTAQQNRQLIDSIIASVGLDQTIKTTKKKSQWNMKDAAVQTSKPFCQVCDIRNSAINNNASTSTDPEQFSKSVYTQVIEKDLVNSKVVLTPGGGIADGAHISLSHMTPSQLVTQLAARAKTLKKTTELPSGGGADREYWQRNADSSNFYRDNQYQNNYNYRY